MSWGTVLGPGSTVAATLFGWLVSWLALGSSSNTQSVEYVVFVSSLAILGIGFLSHLVSLGLTLAALTDFQGTGFEPEAALLTIYWVTAFTLIIEPSSNPGWLMLPATMLLGRLLWRERCRRRTG